MSYYTVDLLTPSEVLAKDVPADELLIPTVRGQINVLNDHTHIITELDTGILTLKAPNGVRKFHVTHGVCKVLEHKVTVLAGVSEEDRSIDITRAQEALKRAKEKLSGMDPLTDHEFKKFYMKIRRAENRIELAKNGKKVP
ncbi:MAG: ATP synthase F1 subunit epsilon [Halobacteriovoraceae bacterium]|nr:ATP synthase F1 subunit epsilon [Halobacteriovoraceae bacterium]